MGLVVVKGYRIYSGLILVVTALFVARLLLTQEDLSEPSEDLELGESKDGLARMKDFIRRDYNTPIDFWGKVIDQDGNPLAGVEAEIVLDEAISRKKYVSTSDEGGLFELLGKNGARARVKVALRQICLSF